MDRESVLTFVTRIMRKLCAELPALFFVFYCKNINGKDAVCANNCPGTDPNAVVVGGTALVLAPAVATVGTAVAAGNLLGPMLGAG